ncbi:MAG: hypothetical protein V5B32_00950 [Candidatus Accumulibacter sp. UW26]|jgi:hypothetical protein
MTDDSDLIDRANSLINADTAAAGSSRESSRRLRRRRSFLASTTLEVTTLPALPGRPAGDDDDLPLLTEVVLPALPADAKSAGQVAPVRRPDLAADLVDLIDRRLQSELPALIDATVQHASDHLRRGIDAAVGTAVRDFLAERGQLRLPLEDPAADREDSSGQA